MSNGNIIGFSKIKAKHVAEKEVAISKLSHAERLARLMSHADLEGIKIDTIYDNYVLPLVAPSRLASEKSLSEIETDMAHSLTVLAILSSRILLWEPRFGVSALNVETIELNNYHRMVCELVRFNEYRLLDEYQHLDFTRIYGMWAPAISHLTSPVSDPLIKTYPIKVHSSPISMDTGILNLISEVERQCNFTIPFANKVPWQIHKLNRTYIFIYNDTDKTPHSHHSSFVSKKNTSIKTADQIVIMTTSGKLIDFKVVGI